MGRCWGWVAGAVVVLAISAAPSEAQVRIGAGIPEVGAGISIGSPWAYGDRFSRRYSRPVRVYRGRAYDYRRGPRWDREYREDVRRAQREYQRELREARREFARDLRDARRVRRR